MYQLIDRFIEKLMKESTPDRPFWNIESIKAGKEPHWNYIDGCMMTSLLELYKETKEEKYIKFVENFIDFYVFEDGTLRGYHQENYSTDDICESRVLFDLYEITGKEKYSKAIDYTYQQIMHQPRTKEGSFWHKKIYPNQVWLDGLFMAQPFYTLYETFRNKKQNYIDIIHQFKTVRRVMFNPEKKLYYHGYDASKTMFWADPATGLSKNFWLRAMGWYVVGIVDVMGYMDDEKQKKNFFFPLLKEIIDGLLMYQDQDSKLFYQVVDMKGREGNYLEASGSALISYAILKGTRLKALEPRYEQIGLDIFNGIAKKYLSEKNGDLNLGGICLVAGLGPENNLRRDGSYQYYISEPVVENDAKGVGPLIMAYTEVKKVLKKNL
ncbi:MAG: glycosyl hydrolase family 88 [Tenericutes bacterium GWD2_38_27]|nr:MAG: glycosyl hydrolase family 88 [Tenericutes bacterium GWD2_38_27]OHE42538.1 MAG: glycosyl hydrolase family 88 [Tenericutes bacterium GWF2_38_8]